MKRSINILDGQIITEGETDGSQLRAAAIVLGTESINSTLGRDRLEDAVIEHELAAKRTLGYISLLPEGPIG